MQRVVRYRALWSADNGPGRGGYGRGDLSRPLDGWGIPAEGGPLRGIGAITLAIPRRIACLLGG